MKNVRQTIKGHRVLVLLFMSWALSTSAGMLVLISYSNSSGEVGAGASKWPAGSGFKSSATKFTLLMFLHPRCPCSQASVEQLARIHARCHDHVEIRVFFYCPRDRSEDWARTRLWKAAQRISGTTVAVDPDGQMAGRFGARTSGDVSVYDPSAHLVFHGGITASRGHEGDNIGTSAVIACLRGETPQRDHSPVFGCAISRQDLPDSNRSGPAPRPPSGGEL